MAIKPILFNTEMVRAILDGRKACTRRILKGAIPFDEKAEYWNVLKKGEWSGPICAEDFVKQGSPYQPGDILYVRETWDYLEGWKIGDSGIAGQYFYRADGDHRPVSWRGPWQSSVHMSRKAARIWLLVTDVQAERLQEITEDGAKAEGAIDNRGFIHSPENEYDRIHTAREHFIEIWDSAIKKSDRDRHGWDANPWVWVIEFERCEKPEEESHERE